MFTKEYVREVLEQMCAPYMDVPLSDEYVQKIYDDFVAIRNGDAVEHTLAVDNCPRCDGRGEVRNGGFVWVACPVCDGAGVATKA